MEKADAMVINGGARRENFNWPERVFHSRRRRYNENNTFGMASGKSVKPYTVLGRVPNTHLEISGGNYGRSAKFGFPVANTY